jgi:hypothetical protein
MLHHGKYKHAQKLKSKIRMVVIVNFIFSGLFVCWFIRLIWFMDNCNLVNFQFSTSNFQL